jgi:voltage-gated potassium channel
MRSTPKAPGPKVAADSAKRIGHGVWSLKRSNSTPPGYEFFMLVLCFYALAQLGVQAVFQLEPATREVVDYADFMVCVVFLLDFLITLLRSPDRLRYMATWGWVDLLSSIPSIDVVRWGRLARILRVFRVLRGLRATKTLSLLILRRRAENTFLAVSLVALLVLVFCSIAVLHFETDPNSNIKTAEDGLWWAVTTMTTVGYGDRFPVTTEGRMVAVLLMAAGVGLFGTFSGLLAAWLIGPTHAGDAASNESLRLEIAALREEVRKLASQKPKDP